MPFIVAVPVAPFWGSFVLSSVTSSLLIPSPEAAPDPGRGGLSPSHFTALCSDKLKAEAVQVKMLGCRPRWWGNAFHSVPSASPAQSAHTAHKHFYHFKQSLLLKKLPRNQTLVHWWLEGRVAHKKFVITSVLGWFSTEWIKMRNSAETLESSFLLSNNYKSPVCQSNHHEEEDGKRAATLPQRSHQPW